jgi:hypothetical protein
MTLFVAVQSAAGVLQHIAAMLIARNMLVGAVRVKVRCVVTAEPWRFSVGHQSFRICRSAADPM